MYKFLDNASEANMQCVEFVRNYLRVHKGLFYADVNIAADMWSKINAFIRINDCTELPVINIVNGASTHPEIDDILIYSEELYGTGHVAIVTRVDLANNYIEVHEQNYANQKTPPDLSRRIPLIKHQESFWLLDTYLLGWKTLI